MTRSGKTSSADLAGFMRSSGFAIAGFKDQPYGPAVGLGLAERRLRMVSHYQGLTHTSFGRLSGSSGRGRFRRSDGCAGSWTASR